MRLGRPWNVEGVGPRVQETARVAARRSGMTVGEWLNAVIIEQAAEDGVRDVQSEDSDTAPQHSDAKLAAINDRLVDLIRQLARLERGHAPAAAPESGVSEKAPRHLAEAIARLDQRLDQMTAEGRFAVGEIERRVTSVDQALTNLGRARLQTTHAPAPQSYRNAKTPDSDPLERARGFSSSAAPKPPVDEQRVSIDAAGHQSLINDAIQVLRADLADIKRTLAEALPLRAIEAIESEVRSLAQRLDDDRDRSLDPAAIAGLERGLAEVRDALRGLSPADRLVDCDQVVQALSRKIDVIAEGHQDPRVLQQIDVAIGCLRGIAAQVASSEALASVASDVRLLAEKLERIDPVGNNFMLNLDKRIATMADALEAARLETARTIPAEFDTRMKALSDKLDSVRAPVESPPAATYLDSQISQIVEKLDASAARLTHLGSIERGLGELVIHFEEFRTRAAAAMTRPAASPDSSDTVELLKHDVAEIKQAHSTAAQLAANAIEAVQGTIGDVVNRLAMVETDMRQGGQPFGVVSSEQQREYSPSDHRAAWTADEWKPSVRAQMRSAGPDSAAGAPRPATIPAANADPDLLSFQTALSNSFSQPAAVVTSFGPDPASQPVQPPNPPPASVSARQPIDPTLPPDTPLEPGSGKQRAGAAVASRATSPAEQAVVADTVPRADFIAAARRAAQAAASGRMESRVRRDAVPGASPKTLTQRVKSLFVGGSAVLIVAALFRLGFEYLDVARTDGSDERGAVRQVAAVPVPLDATIPGLKVASSPGPNALSARPRPSTNAPQVLDNPALNSSPAATTARSESPAAGDRQGGQFPGNDQTNKVASNDVTGTASSAGISQQALSAPSAVKVPDRSERVASGTALQAALAAGDPAAAYEMGCRFAEGRGGGVNIQQAMMWFDRAAKAGSIPALFRLGTFYEKGDGVARDLQEARRLYIAAAEKGHTKAMHNLAVLYANGIDGKPDYATAALWFRKAASYAVADSEYNLGVLYARGIGVEQNLAESFKWFALAAAQGDQEAAKKRDDVASHLDGPTLDVARLAVETFVAETQPATATVGPPPSGGWDQVISGVPRAKPPSRVTVPQPRLTSLEPVFPFGGEH